MNRLIISSLLLLNFSVFGHEKNDTLFSKQRRFSIGINTSPDYCYRALTKNDNSISDVIWNSAKNYEDSIEKPKFGYTFGINFCYQITKRVSIEAGIQYSNKGYKTIPIETISSIDFTRVGKAKNIISHKYFDFPVKVTYIFFDKRIQFIASLGVTLNALVKTSIYSIPEDKSKNEFNTEIDYPYEKINLSPTFSAGIKYKLKERMNLLAEPTVRYSILNIDQKSYKSTHLWNLGLNIGYYYEL
jgi:hypothetical protein